MISGLWGKKVGMTQLFSEKNKVVPVTVIDTAHWFVTQVKTDERDGYKAIQIACLRKKYQDICQLLNRLKTALVAQLQCYLPQYSDEFLSHAQSTF